MAVFILGAAVPPDIVAGGFGGGGLGCFCFDVPACSR